jgi:3',5'-cyclic AMP phosphodiesterase CpdA
VVREMQRFAPHLAAVVTTGDNAYCCGTPAQVAFAKSVLAPLHAKVYPAFGNHDEVTQGGQPLLAAFGLTQRWYDVTVGPIELVFLDANQASNRAQLDFLDQVLLRPRPVPFRIVVFHQPGWSCSFHPPDPGVVRYFLPRFVRGGVDLVLAGHNHTYERFIANNGTPLVTTGGGGAPLYPSARAACRSARRVWQVVHVKTRYHALRLTADDVFLKVEAIGTDGTVFDHFVMSRSFG